MKVLLRRMESLGGLDVATDESLDVDRVALGRGTDQDVQLPDVRVTLNHAEIRQHPGGGYRIECLGENPVLVNGSPQLSAALGVGDAIDLGRFRLTLQRPPAGMDLVLEIEERTSAREEQSRRRGQYPLSLEQAGLGKRKWAWGLAALVLVPLFVLPIVLRYAAGGDTGKSLDTTWQSGPPSAAHSPFIEDCDVCHQAPFEHVPNTACLACHKDQPHHSDRPEILALGTLREAQCGACHQEHSGREALIARSTSLCTDCHAEPDRDYAAAKLPAVHSFSGDHPGFTLSLPELRQGRMQHVEVSQSPQLREASNLRFPHDVHVAAKGVSSPQGLRVLACADCHVPAGATFEPIRMEDHCGSCHRLDFDPDKPVRRLPHSAPSLIAAIIRDHFARMALAGQVEEPDAPPIVRLLRRPGETLTPEQSKAALTWADARAATVMQDVFERRVCAECHTVDATDDPEQPYEVEPVVQTASFLTGARFDHAAHRSESCDRCHEAKLSKASTDLLIPTIDNCRECHGDPGTPDRMGTACVDCHGFHMAKRGFELPMPTPERQDVSHEDTKGTK